MSGNKVSFTISLQHLVLFFRSLNSLIRIETLPLLILTDSFLSKRMETTQTEDGSCFALGYFLFLGFLLFPSKGLKA